MARQVSVCRFSDGTHKFFLYCNTSDVCLRPLFHTAAAAQAWEDSDLATLEECSKEELAKEESVLVWTREHQIEQPELLNEDDAWATFALRSAMRITGETDPWGPEPIDCSPSCFRNGTCGYCQAIDDRANDADFNAEVNAGRAPVRAAFVAYPSAEVLAAHAAEQSGTATALQSKLARAVREALGKARSLQPLEANDFVLCAEESRESRSGFSITDYCKAFIVAGAVGGAPVALSVAREEADEFDDFAAFQEQIPGLARDAEREMSLHGLIPLNNACRIPLEEAWHTPAKAIASQLLRDCYLDESAPARKESEALAVVVAEAALRAESSAQELVAERARFQAARSTRRI